MKDSFASGAKSSFAATGGSSTQGTVGDGQAAGASSLTASTAESGQPAWAQRMRRNQAIHQGATTAANALRSGDSHGGGHSVNLSGGE